MAVVLLKLMQKQGMLYLRLKYKHLEAQLSTVPTASRFILKMSKYDII